nr:hypothetical protein [Propionibacterium sp.]
MAALAADLARAPRPAVLIDGPSGAGKTTLARRLGAVWPGPIALVSLDDVYPGWDGLAAGAAAVPGLLGDPSPGYRRWDWQRGRPAEWVALDPGAPIIVEGCGALTPASRARASFGIWVDADPAARRRRALSRDGDAYAPHWDRWAAQERAHWAAHRPWELADLHLNSEAVG